MKTLLESLNKQALNETVDKEIDLYLSSDDSDDPDTITIDLTKIKNPMKNFGEITFSYEPHGGFYFKGKSKCIKTLQKAIEEDTDIFLSEQ